ncbi:hypothetical protein Tco_0900775, partial [Tanacetum coccineum]
SDKGVFLSLLVYVDDIIITGKSVSEIEKFKVFLKSIMIKDLGSKPINRGLIQAISTSLPPQPIGEATKASNLRRIPPGVQGRSHFTYFL